jgi:AcrR family transcriptional regulator
MQNSDVGLRERKRLETRERLETAATQIVLRDGLEHATIDAICEAADVSPRTFFNYFDRKEDAVLGVRDGELTDDVVAEELAAHSSGQPTERVIRLLFRILSPSIASTKLHASRMEIMRLHPHLLGRMAAQFTRLTEQLVKVVVPILGERPEFAGEPPAELEISAEILLSICSAATRAALREWASNGNDLPIEAVELRAIQLAEKTMEKLK